MKKLSNNKEMKTESRIICDLHVGEILSRIRGLDYFKTTYEYKVVGEYPYLYQIRIRYRNDLTPEWKNYVYTSISKSSIYCGDVVLTKEDGRTVTSYLKGIYVK